MHRLPVAGLRGVPTILLLATAFALGAASLNAGAAESSVPAAATPAEDVFAKVGATVISAREFDAAFNEAARQKFYHGRPPEAEIAALRREVGDRLINRVLLLAEAGRRAIKPDQDKIRKTIAAYDQRYGASEQWKANREKLLPGLTGYLETQSIMERLEADVRNGREASEAEARAYYDAHTDHFTEPEQNKVSVILLKVDPSSPQAAWDKAKEEGDAILKRLRAGADFGELARIHSADVSATSGGDMGYLHRGMLPDKVQAAVDVLKPGDFTEPLFLLDGVAIVRLDERKAAKRREYSEARERASALWKRDRADEEWKKLIARLRSSVTIEIDESRYPVAGAGGAK
ncbi:MAG: peptidyl-prolyl cis-trans isomerase [Betaproteobacteria bacterium]|nr:peptidyl-prolyl cis-trans isomerase [Betaproteobacteria bacterium]